MKVKRVFAPDMRQAMRRVRDDMGDRAVIISNHRVAGGVEVVAAREEDYELAQAEIRRNRQRQSERKPPAREPDDALQEEMQRVRMRIAEAQQRAEQPLPVQPHADRQIDDEEDEDLRFILTSLKARQQERAQAQVEENPWELDEAPLSRSEETLSSTHLVKGMQEEIHQLRTLLEQQMQLMKTPAAMPTAAPVFSDAQQTQVAMRLKQMGVGDKLIQQLIASVEPGLEVDAVWKNVLARLADSLPVIGEEYIARGGMIAFVGTTGVGKTTTIGKLAARYVLQHGSSGLALVTTDCFRIAAHEQLRTFGRILDVPVRVVDENHNLEEVLMSLRNKRLVLIDTAGMNARDPMGQMQMEMLASVSLRVKKLLVLSCSSQRQLLESAYQNYASLGLNGCVLSKLDESGSLGEALTLAVERQLPIAYVADGQKIPDDLVVAQRRDLIGRAVVTAEQQQQGDTATGAVDPQTRAG